MMRVNEEVTIVCWKWGTKYSAIHVNALASMLEQLVSIPYQLLCLTDDPKGINCETVPAWNYPVVINSNRPKNWRKLYTLSSRFQNQFDTPLVAQIDLDVLITSNIDHLFQLPDTTEFKILTGTIFKGKELSLYNSSFWVCRNGARSFIFDQFNPRTSPQLIPSYYKGSDQAWISYLSENEEVFTIEDGIGQHKSRHENLPMLFFAGSDDPWNRRVSSDIRKKYKEFTNE